MCENVTCQGELQCNRTTGQCECPTGTTEDQGRCFATESNPCDGVTCETGKTCNPESGACEIQTPPADSPASDQDGDGVPDATDNCPLVANPDQVDNNNDHIGDACDDDDDGITNDVDNCPNTANPDQHDSDIPTDGIGDACSDNDGDGIVNAADNCPEVVNADQANVCGTAPNPNPVGGGGGCSLNPSASHCVASSGLTFFLSLIFFVRFLPLHRSR